MTDRNKTRKSRSKAVAPLTTMGFIVHDLTDRRIFSNVHRRLKKMCPISGSVMGIPHEVRNPY